jgi:hypothetical protein
VPIHGGIVTVDRRDLGRVLLLRWWVTTNKAGNNYAVGYVPPELRDSTTPRSNQVTLHVWLLGKRRGDIDHKNGNGLDNRRCNLRPCTRSQNAANSRLRLGRKFKGVYKAPKASRYHARIKFQGKNRYLGTFKNPEEAARAYNRAAKELHGAFSRPNKIQ